MGTSNRRPGIVLIDKPRGSTSFQTLGPLKKQLGTKKIGHSGTLDKFASGLMVVLVNRATKLVPLFTGMDKTYRATIRFGQETDTLDPEGRVIDTGPLLTSEVIKDTLDTVLASFIGEQEQIPPVFSAIHVHGARAYERTLRGEELELAPRKITLHHIEVHSVLPEYLDITVECSKGTYIRSLARDIARALGTCGSLSALRRLRVGPFSVDDGVGLAEFDPSVHCKEGKELARIVPFSGSHEISDEQARVVRNGSLTDELRQELGEYQILNPDCRRVFLLAENDILGMVGFDPSPDLEWVVGG